MQSFFSASAKKKTLGGRRERKKCKLNGKSSARVDEVIDRLLVERQKGKIRK
jgi:hypothetical protein